MDFLLPVYTPTLLDQHEREACPPEQRLAQAVTCYVLSGSFCLILWLGNIGSFPEDGPFSTL